MNGSELITAERRRQIDVEGWTSKNDDEHRLWQLSRAARCYALPHVDRQTPIRPDWPWHTEWWKPSDDPIKNLVKAGALIAAEIDRLQRLGKKMTKQASIRKRLEPFIARGTSKYICCNFSIRCLNMGSDDGRECNFGQPCYSRAIRKKARKT